jgi:hypothetical protein
MIPQLFTKLDAYTTTTLYSKKKGTIQAYTPLRHEKSVQNHLGYMFHG